MALPRPADLSLDLLEDFRLDAAEEFPRCEHLLFELDNFPHDSPRLRELLRFHDAWADELSRHDRVHTYAGFHIADVRA
mgnify:CR=1 FL=1